MFNRHFQKNQQHNRIHQRLGLSNVTQHNCDKLCEHCYPLDLVLSRNFNNFWNWYSSKYPARTYTRYTQQYLEELSYVEGNDIWLAVIDLIYSIRYAYTPDTSFEALQQELWNAHNISQGFQLSPYQFVDQYNELSFLTPQGSDNSSEDSLFLPEEPAFDLYSEDLNLNLLFQQLENMAQANQQDIQRLQAAILALTQALPNTNNALVGNTQAINNPPRHEGRVAELPYFYGGNQDPVAWLEDFTRSCNANEIANAQKLEVVPAYLKGATSTWWNANQNLNNGNANRIVAWTGNNNNTDFILNFPNAFRTQTLIEI